MQVGMKSVRIFVLVFTTSISYSVVTESAEIQLRRVTSVIIRRCVTKCVLVFLMVGSKLHLKFNKLAIFSIVLSSFPILINMNSVQKLETVT